MQFKFPRQIGLRSLFLVVFVVSIGCCVAAGRYKAHRREVVAATEVIRSGGRVVWTEANETWLSPLGFGRRVSQVQLSGPIEISVVDAFTELREFELSRTKLSVDLILVLSTRRLTSLRLREVVTSTAAMKALTELNELRSLHITDSRIGNESFGFLKSMSSLEELVLDGTDCNDEAIAIIRLLPQLKMLGLARTLTTDRGVGLLAAHPNLVELRLDGTKVTDLSLESLSRLPSLRYVSLSETQVTGESALKLAHGLRTVTIAPFYQIPISISPPWESFSSEALHRKIELGLPVLVCFAATWDASSISQYANLRDSPTLLATADAGELTLMVADCTNGTPPAAEAQLREVMTTSFPVTVVYTPINAQPRILTGMVSPSRVLQVLGE